MIVLDTQELIKLVVSAYAKKHGISEEQAKILLEPILRDRNRLEELYQTLKEAAVIGETMSSLPEDVKPVASRLINEHFMGEEDDLITLLKEMKKLALQLKIIEYVLGSTLGPQRRPEEDEYLRRIIEENEKLRRENEELKKKITEILNLISEAKKKKEMEELRSSMEQLRQQIQILKSSIETKLSQTKNPEAVRSELDILASTLRRFIEIQNMLKQLGAINEAQKIPEELLEKIKNPPSSGEGLKVWLEALDKILKLAQIASRKNTLQQPVSSIPTIIKEEEKTEEEFVPIKKEEKKEKEEEPEAIIVGAENE